MSTLYECVPKPAGSPVRRSIHPPDAFGAGAYHQDMLCDAEEVRSSPSHNEIFAPSGLTNLVGLSVPMPVGEATQFFAFEGTAANKRSRRAYQLLRLVLPAFAAGIRMQQEIRGRSAAVAAMLNGLGQPIAIYSRRGTLLHHSRALTGLLASDAESSHLTAAADTIARSLIGRLSGTEEQVLACAPTTSICTTRSEYRLVGSYLPPELIEGVLVHVEPVGPVLPTPAEVRDRLGLTRREAEVAILLAQGMSDARVARQLTVSTHTARRYSERVLKKLGLHSRAAVALALLKKGAPLPLG